MSRPLLILPPGQYAFACFLILLWRLVRWSVVSLYRALRWLARELLDCLGEVPLRRVPPAGNVVRFRRP